MQTSRVRAAREAHPYPEGFAATTATTFLIVSGFAALTPVLPLYGDALRLDAVRVGIVIGSFGLARFLTDLGGGLLADRLGFRRVAVAGCLTTTVGALLSAQAGSYRALLVGQLLQGLGSALYTTSAMTVVVALAGPEARGRVMSRYQAAILLAFSVGPGVGGLLGGSVGLRAPFVFYAVVAAVCAALAVWSIPRTLPSAGDDGRVGEGTSLLRAVRRLLAGRAFRISILVTTAGYAVRTGVRNTMLPLFAVTEFGLGVTAAGAVLVVAVLSDLAVMGHAGASLDRYGRRPVTVASTAATALVVASLAVVTASWQVVVVAGLLGAVSGYVGLAPVAILADVVDPRTPGLAVGLQRMGLDLGMVLGPVAAGFGTQHLGLRPTFLVFAVLMSVVAVVAVRVPETAARPRGDR